MIYVAAGRSTPGRSPWRPETTPQTSWLLPLPIIWRRTFRIPNRSWRSGNRNSRNQPSPMNQRQPTELRPLGATEILVTPIAMGCWPIAGITSIDVNELDSLATLQAAFQAGINFFDTAYCYGFEGESERMIARALSSHRHEIVIATKGGIHWENGKQARDGSPATLKRQCEESLRRLSTDRVDLLYLHAPDPNVPLADSAGALKELLAAGKTRSVGLSNASLGQLAEFSAVCPL